MRNESTKEKPKRRRACKSNNAVKVKSDDDKNGDSNSNNDYSVGSVKSIQEAHCGGR